MPPVATPTSSSAGIGPQEQATLARHAWAVSTRSGSASEWVSGRVGVGVGVGVGVASEWAWVSESEWAWVSESAWESELAWVSESAWASASVWEWASWSWCRNRHRHRGRIEADRCSAGRDRERVAVGRPDDSRWRQSLDRRTDAADLLEAVRW